MKNIILGIEKHSPNFTGNKAANLFKLKSAGFNVPDWLTIVPSALGDDARRQDHLLQAELTESLALPQFQNALLAVRSSAVDEDGKNSSYAGQLDSFLNVSPEWVMTAVRSVWLSGSNERLSAYQAGMKLQKTNSGTAVIVQRMVNAKLAGVAFSADPISGDRKTVVINAVDGLADKLVSGEVTGDLIYVHSDNAVLRKQHTIAVGINDSIVLEIANTARAIEKHFGCPQDIEWAHDGIQLFILQARPITTLKEDETLRIWDNSNISESYQGVTTPLTFSFAAKAYEHVYIHFCKLMGVSDERIQANRQIFPSMLGFVRGRIYYNLVNWYRLLAMLPGFQVNRPFMEQMMGVKEELPAEIIKQVQKENHVGAMKAHWNFLVSLSAMAVRFANLKTEINKFQNHFNSTISEVPEDLQQLSTDELLRLYRNLERKLLLSWDAPLVNDFFAMVFFGLLGSLSAKWFPTNSFSHHELLVRSGGIVSAEPALLIGRMADIAAKDLALSEALKTDSLDEIEKLIDGNVEFKIAFEKYLKKFADRCFNELKLESQSLNDNPLPLLRNVGFMTSARTLRQSEQILEASTSQKQIAKLPLLKRLVFNFVAWQAIERIRWRENLRFERTRLFGLVRRIFLELGSKFTQSGVLTEREDIFYLEVEEVLNFVEGKGTTRNLAALVELRRAETNEFKSTAAPPNRIVSRESVLNFEDFGENQTKSPSNNLAVSSADQQTLQGLGCSPGFVRGRVRVVRNPSTAKPLEDEILIAERTDPGWIVLFTQAKGIIVEYGSLLSHTAIVSRELGIPAIVSCSGVMNWLADGDLIEFNGKTGVIRKLEEKRMMEHDLSDNVVKLIESTGLRQEAS